MGSVDETALFRAYVDDKQISEKPIKEVMKSPFPIVEKTDSIDKVSRLISKDNQAVLVSLGDDNYHIITKHDIISAIH